MDIENKTPSSHSTRRWRTVGGFLVGLLILFFLTFSTKSLEPSLMESHPWLRYPFLAVLLTACFVFIVIWKKDRVAAVADTDAGIAQDGKPPPGRAGVLLRLAAAIPGIILFILALDYGLSLGFRAALQIILLGGYSFLCLRVTVTGKWR
jgi:hypothetical protein